MKVSALTTGSYADRALHVPAAAPTPLEGDQGSLDPSPPACCVGQDPAGWGRGGGRGEKIYSVLSPRS